MKRTNQRKLEEEYERLVRGIQTAGGVNLTNLTLPDPSNTTNNGEAREGVMDTTREEEEGGEGEMEREEDREEVLRAPVFPNEIGHPLFLFLIFTCFNLIFT